MALIAHPLTQLNGSPQYTADNYRKVVNALLTPSDGTAFGTVAGVRAGSPSPLISVSGTTVTVKAHAGVLCPWTGVGGYTYALDAQATVNVADSTGSYKIALVLSDPSQSHGSAPGIVLQSFPASTANSSINGLVIGQVAAGTASDTAPRILQQTMITVSTLAALNALTGVEGQKATVTNDPNPGNNTTYGFSAGTWQRSSGDFTALIIDALNTQWWESSRIRLTADEKVVRLTFKLKRRDSTWTGGDGKNRLFTIPDGLLPDYPHWITVEPRFGTYIAVNMDGDKSVCFGKVPGYAGLSNGADIDFSVWWHRA